MAEDAQQDEFDVLATWTVESVERLGPDHAIPAACRGSGGPGALAWLADWLDSGSDGCLADVGAGLGGPTAWLAESTGRAVVAVEPMSGAAEGSRRLFGLPAVISTAQALPFASGACAGASALGVLSTTDAKVAALTEMRRIVVPGAPVALVTYLAGTTAVPHPPEGTFFGTWPDLTAAIGQAGLALDRSVALEDLPDADETWRRRAARVEDDLECRHGNDPRWIHARRNEQRVAELLETGHVVGHAVRLVAV